MAKIKDRVARDFEGGLIVSALEGEFLVGANLVEDVPVLLLQPSDLLHELILVEIELQLRLDLVGSGGFFSSISSRKHRFGLDESARTMVAVGFKIGASLPPLETKELGTATVTPRAVEGEGMLSSSSSSSYSSSS